LAVILLFISKVTACGLCDISQISIVQHFRFVFREIPGSNLVSETD